MVLRDTITPFVHYFYRQFEVSWCPLRYLLLYCIVVGLSHFKLSFTTCLALKYHYQLFISHKKGLAAHHKNLSLGFK